VSALAQGESLSSIEERVRLYLIERAKLGNPSAPSSSKVAYGTLCSAIDPEQRHWAWPRYRGIGETLGRVSSFEHQHGRPLLSVMVVQTATWKPGEGFIGIAKGLGFHIPPGHEREFERHQLEEVVRYWTVGGWRE
jgi:hypothetical protein